MWLPRPLYEAIPYVYSGVGAALIAAALLIADGPRGLLLAGGVVALTAGLMLWMRRRDYRSSHREYDSRSLDD
jgi:hypothetical protein